MGHKKSPNQALCFIGCAFAGTSGPPKKAKGHEEALCSSGNGVPKATLVGATDEMSCSSDAGDDAREPSEVDAEQPESVSLPVVEPAEVPAASVSNDDQASSSDHDRFAPTDPPIDPDGVHVTLDSPTNLTALIDFPKPRPKPMKTPLALFEDEMRPKSSDELKAVQKDCKAERDTAFQVIKTKYKAGSVDVLYESLDRLHSALEKIDAINAFEHAKDMDNRVNCLPNLIEKKVAEEAKEAAGSSADSGDSWSYEIKCGAGASAIAAIGSVAFGPAPPLFIGNLLVFLLASFLGYHLITEVKPSLYTPLMSMSNAISGIVIVGGMLQIQGKYLWPEIGSATQALGALAVGVSAINIAGGFAVTFRMLNMFKKS